MVLEIAHGFAGNSYHSQAGHRSISIRLSLRRGPRRPRRSTSEGCSIRRSTGSSTRNYSRQPTTRSRAVTADGDICTSPSPRPHPRQSPDVHACIRQTRGHPVVFGLPLHRPLQGRDSEQCKFQGRSAGSRKRNSCHRPGQTRLLVRRRR